MLRTHVVIDDYVTICFACEYGMFATAQLLSIWFEKWPKDQGTLTQVSWERSEVFVVWEWTYF